MQSNLIVKVDTKKLIVFLCFIILFISSWAPFIDGNPLGTYMLRRILNYSLWIFATLAILFGTKRVKCGTFEIITMMAILIYRAYGVFYAYDYKGIGLTSIILGIFFCIQKDEIRSEVFKCFKSFTALVSIIGIICYISYVMHFGIPYTIVARGGGVFWVDYKICYLINQNDMIIRLCGLFEEPGWLGTWIAFFLCADSLNFKKKENIILLIAGLFTFSLAFFLLLIMYYIIKSFNNWKKWVCVFILTIFYLCVLPKVRTGNYAIDHVLERMVITKDGLAGDNRYGSLFDELWEQTIHSGKIYLGYGAGYAEILGTGEGQGLASIKSYLVNFGIIGTLVIFGPIFIASVRKSRKSKNKEMLFYIIITFISLYQRPYLFWTPYFIIFLCGVSYTAMEHSKSSFNERPCDYILGKDICIEKDNM